MPGSSALVLCVTIKTTAETIYQANDRFGSISVVAAAANEVCYRKQIGTRAVVCRVQPELLRAPIATLIDIRR